MSAITAHGVSSARARHEMPLGGREPFLNRLGVTVARPSPWCTARPPRETGRDRGVMGMLTLGQAARLAGVGKAPSAAIAALSSPDGSSSGLLMPPCLNHPKMPRFGLGAGAVSTAGDSAGVGAAGCWLANSRSRVASFSSRAL